MRRAAAQLSPLPQSIGPAHPVHLLTGDRYWHQTTFCLWSLARVSGCNLAPFIYDDGSLTNEQRSRLCDLFPHTQVVSNETVRQTLHSLLPATSYPFLHERWRNYPHIRKLINPHLGSTGAKLVMDSDLLFFRRPQFLLDWLEHPNQPLHAVDSETSYGYPMEALVRLAGAPLDPLVNVGLAGLRSESLDWDRIEFWVRSLLQAHGTHYVLEQALTAMLVAGQSCAVAPAADYVTCPELPEALHRQAVMHHYVAGSKRWYFQNNWQIVRDLGAKA